MYDQTYDSYGVIKYIQPKPIVITQSQIWSVFTLNIMDKICKITQRCQHIKIYIYISNCPDTIYNILYISKIKYKILILLINEQFSTVMHYIRQSSDVKILTHHYMKRSVYDIQGEPLNI